MPISFAAPTFRIERRNMKTQTEAKVKGKYYYITRFWGDPGPYSQIRTERETRILDEDVSRDLYYLYANINPTTIELLKEYRDIIKDPKILHVLDEAEYINQRKGYYWRICERIEDDDEEVDRQRITATETLINMHKMALQIFCSKFLSND